MITEKNYVAITIALVVLSLLAPGAKAQSSSKSLVVVLDRTGSMNATRSTGNTRCRDAFDLAVSDIQNFPTSNMNPSSYAVVVFDSAVTDLTGGFVDRATALADLNALDPLGCGGTTALADAICHASDLIVNAFPNANFSDRVVAISSDGGENSSSGPCAGPSSSSFPMNLFSCAGYDPGSWQRNACEELVNNALVVTRFWNTVVNRGGRAEASAGEPAFGLELEGEGQEFGGGDSGFFRHLATVTSGVYQGISDDADLPASFFNSLFASSFSGPEGLSTFAAINSATGSVTTIGPIGFERCSALAAESSGRFFATCERADGSDTPVLVSIDTSTGLGTEIGPTGLSGSVSDISIRDADGTLFAYDADASSGHTLSSIDTSTGQGTLIGPTGLGPAAGNAMSFDLSGRLFHSQTGADADPELYLIDPASGTASFVRSLPISPPPSNLYRFNSMDVDPSTEALFAVLNDGTGGGGPRYLTTIDTDSSAVDILGETGSAVDGLVWSKSTLSDNVCGDGVVQSDFEQCDDGNRDDGDGCESNCRWTLIIPDNECADASQCTAFGFTNLALGAAQLALDPSGDFLEINNIGSSYQDGASQLMPDTTFMRTDLGVPNFSLSSTGARMRFEQVGLVSGVPGQLFSVFEVENTGSILQLEADMSFVGSTSYRIELFAGRSLVTVQSGLDSGILLIPIGDVAGGDCRMLEDGTIVITGDGPVVTAMTIPGRGTFNADNWRISTEDFTFVATAQQEIRMLAANTGNLLITRELSTPGPGPTDCNADGVPDSDTNDDGIPDPCEDNIFSDGFESGDTSAWSAVVD